MKNFKKSLFVSIGIILAAIIAASGALYFFSNDLSGKTDKILSDKTMITERSAAVASLAQLKHDAPIAAAYTDAVNKLLPTHDDLIGFPNWIDGLAQAHNVGITVAFTGSNVPANGNLPGTDSFSLTATGALADLAAFLEDIELHAQNFIATIDTFNVVSSGSSYSLSLQGKVFSRP